MIGIAECVIAIILIYTRTGSVYNLTGDAYDNTGRVSHWYGIAQDRTSGAININNGTYDANSSASD